MQTEKKTWIYGRKPVLEYLKEGGQVEKVYIQSGIHPAFVDEITQLIKSAGIPVQKVPRVRLDKMLRKNHQGVLALKSAIEYQNIANILPLLFDRGVLPIILVCDGITDVRNFGAIARSAEVLGVDAIVIPSVNTAQLNADAIKTSAGALLKIPVCRVRRLDWAIKLMRDSGLQILMSDMKAENTISDVNLTGPVAIVVGSEDKGVSRKMLGHAEILFKIPQFGQTESLNVSVATGIILYEVQRQRKTIG